MTASWVLNVLTPWQWANLVAAIFSAWGAWWVVDHTDIIIDWLFPHREWEHSLGWLNIRAEKRAKAGMRWAGYFAYAILAAALAGIVWAAVGFRDAAGHWFEPDIFDHLVLRVLALLVSMTVWFFFLGCDLMPRWHRERARREWAALRKLQAEEAREREGDEEEAESPSRLRKPQPKVRVSSPFDAIIPDRDKKRR